MIQEITQSLQETWQEITEYEYFKYGAAAVLVVALVIGGTKGRSWYVAQREEKAQIAFSDALDEYNSALYYALTKPKETEKIAEHMKDTHLAFEAFLSNHGSSSLASFAKAFDANIFELHNDHAKAIERMEAAVSEMGSSSQFYYLYKTKIALLHFESGKTDQALAQLKDLSDNADNKNSDDAAYYLGAYHWSQQQYKKAADAWKRFDESNQPKEISQRSAWAQVVQAKLSQMS